MLSSPLVEKLADMVKKKRGEKIKEKEPAKKSINIGLRSAN